MLLKRDKDTISGFNGILILFVLFLGFLLFTKNESLNSEHRNSGVPYNLSFLKGSGLINPAIRLDFLPRSTVLPGEYSDIYLPVKRSFVENQKTNLSIIQLRNLRERYHYNPIFIRLYHHFPEDNDYPPDLS
jgi:hypothetical protein